MKKQALSIILSLAVAAGCLTACGNDDSSGSKKDKETTVSKVDTEALDAMQGTYVCTFVIVNMYGTDAGYKSSEIENKYMNCELTIDGDTLTLDGKQYTLSPEKSDNAYYTYLVSVPESGYSSRASSKHSNRQFVNSDFDGPAWFMFAAKGTDQDGTALETDTIDMYYSPAGTEDWYFSLDFKKK